jgi:small GTP-binding protein
LNIVWDTAGTERFRTITPTYYKNCDGVLLVYDITDEKSFETIKFWISELNENTDISKVNLLLVGNKSDLEQRRAVSLQRGQELAKEILV